MTEVVQLSGDGSCIQVVSSGQPSLAEMKRTLAAIADLRRASGVDKVLVDSRARSGQPSIADLFHGGELVARELGSDARVAILVAERDQDHAFFENVAVNRGAPVAFFDDENAALGWLSNGSD